MKHLYHLLLAFCVTGPVLAGNDAYIISQKRFVRTQPLYQFWSIENSDDFSEFSNLVFAYVPFSRRLGVTLRSSQAVVTGENGMETLGGLTDTQIGLSYYLEGPNLVFNLGVNLPSGKRNLSSAETATSSRISSDIFDLQVPHFGQGFNLSSGLTWAIPVSENLVVGLGASYQFRGAYEPFNTDISYDPGEEVLLTGGLDLRLGERSSISGDAVLTLVAEDKINGENEFDAGNRLLLTLQFKKYFGFNELKMLARYRSRTKDEFLSNGLRQKTLPNQLEVGMRYQMRFSRVFYLGVLAEVKHYDRATAVFSDIDLVGLALQPNLVVSKKVSLPLDLSVRFGRAKGGANLVGFQLGLGLVINY
ncbi:MAG: hypothetical protein ACE5IY_08880 [bacterium]